MYERFTDRALKVMQLANQEAQRFNHEYIGTEHILLGLVKEGSGVAAEVLKGFQVDIRKIRLEVEKLLQCGPEMVSMGKLPQTPRAKKAIEYSMEEARNLNHNYVGTEHILLGLLREQDGVAAHVLMEIGVGLDEAREATLNFLGRGKPKQDAAVSVFDLMKTPIAAMLRTYFASAASGLIAREGFKSSTIDDAFSIANKLLEREITETEKRLSPPITTEEWEIRIERKRKFFTGKSEL